MCVVSRLMPFTGNTMASMSLFLQLIPDYQMLAGSRFYDIEECMVFHLHLNLATHKFEKNISYPVAVCRPFM